MCVIDFDRHLDHFLSLVQFPYNKNYFSNIDRAPFKALYGRSSRSPIGWFDTFEMRAWGTNLLRQSLEKVKTIQNKPLAAQSRLKEYADRKDKNMDFHSGREILAQGFIHEVCCDEVWEAR